MKTCLIKSYFCALCFIVGSLNGHAQYSRITDKDTINYIHKQLFKFINNNIGVIKLDNFKQAKKNKVREIFYGSDDTSISLFNSLFQVPQFKKLLTKDFKDSVIDIKDKVQSIKFRQYAFSKIKKAYCYLVVFPLLRYNDKIYLRVTSYSKKYFDDMYSGHLYFVFNSKMELNYFDFNEVTIDR